GTSVGLFIRRQGKLKRSRHWVLGLRAIYALFVDREDRLNIAAGPYGWWRKDSARQAKRLNRQFIGCFRQSGDRLRGVIPGGDCGQPTAPPASGLPSAHVSMLAVHRGVLFVGHFDKGLARYQTKHQFRLLDDSPRFINALVSDGHTLWIGTARGLFKTRDGQQITRARLRLPSDHINGLARAPDGTIWVATSRGIVGIHGRGIRLIGLQQGLPSTIVYAVAVDQRGRLWAGTDRGVSLFEPSGTKTFTQLQGSLPHDWVTALRADGDCVWVGTYDAGIVRLCAVGPSQALLGGRRVWVNPHGLIPWDQEVLVATLGDGLLRVGHHRRVEPVRGLPSDDVTAVVHAHGRVWIGTRGGLVSRPELRLNN
ncbi:MAG: two-component regulator propeller domain-containing protein, partial [Myxococcota bacterium]|nr:two-component regulator propeller domain-containing protein [Myxococcota bacterium]